MQSWISNDLPVAADTKTYSSSFESYYESICDSTTQNAFYNSAFLVVHLQYGTQFKHFIVVLKTASPNKETCWL